MPTIRQKKAFTFLAENVGNPKPIPLGKILIQAGYSVIVSKTPQKVTESKGFQELLEEALPDDLLTETHLSLLKTTRIEHMVFPILTGEKDEEEPERLEPQAHGGALKRRKKVTEGSTLTDDDIVDMLAEVNCTVRKIVHGETARHVYYWVADSKARSDALKLAYAVKGKLGANDRVPEPTGNTYNTFIQQNQINPNAPEARQLVSDTLDYLMKATKRTKKVVDTP